LIDWGAARFPEPRAARARAGRAGRFLAGLAALLAAGAALRVHALGVQPFDCDELYAVRIVASSWRDLASVLGRVAFHEPHPPLSAIVFAVWVAMAGTGEIAVRALPALLGILDVALAAMVGRRLGGPATGLAAAAFLAFNPLQVAYAQEARPYALAVTLVLAAHLFFLRSLAGEGPRDRLLYGILVAAAVHTHYFALFALLPHGLAALWIVRSAPRPARAAAAQTALASAAGAATLLAWAPALLYQLAFGPGPQEIGTGRVLGTRQVVAWLAEVGGLGASPVLLPAALASLVLVAAAFGVREPLAVDRGGEVRPPLRRRAGGLAMLAAAPAAAALGLAARRATPVAREVLAGYGYGAPAIERELRALAQFALSVPLALAAVGAIVFFWAPLSRRLGDLGREHHAREPRQGTLLALLFAGPLLAAALPGLLGAPIFSTRNLLLFQPALALALGRGAVRLAGTRPGRLLLPALVVCLMAGALQYQPISWVAGLPGTPLGMRTARWRDLDRALGAAEPAPGLLLVDDPQTNPALFYLARHGVTRVDWQADLGAVPMQRGLRFVHLAGDRSSDLLHTALSRRRLLLQRIRVDELVVYEVRGGPADAPTPGVKIAPRRLAPSPTPASPQGGFPP
jgi:4-amino-4-deoxy-L-arabinose transferase-like glycosyltransferase